MNHNICQKKLKEINRSIKQAIKRVSESDIISLLNLSALADVSLKENDLKNFSYVIIKIEKKLNRIKESKN